MIPWKELMRIGFLKLNLTPEVFWNMTFVEFQIYLNIDKPMMVTREELSKMMEDNRD